MAAGITSGRPALVLAAAMGALTAMGADPAPAPVKPSPAEALAKMFPTPRLYDIAVVRDGKPGPTFAFCLGAEPILKMLDAVDAAPRPAATGCTRSTTHDADGAMHHEITCGPADGAKPTFRMTADADARFSTMRQRTEMVLDQGAQPPRTSIMEMTMTQSGDCPADLKTGQARMADGTTVDVTAIFAGLPRVGRAKPEAPKASP